MVAVHLIDLISRVYSQMEGVIWKSPIHLWRHWHTCQLSRFSLESLSFSLNLPVIFGDYSWTLSLMTFSNAKISRHLQIFVLWGLAGMYWLPQQQVNCLPKTDNTRYLYNEAPTGTGAVIFKWRLSK